MIGVLTLIYLVAFPCISLYFLLKNKSRLETTTMIQKYGSLYQNVDPSRPNALWFTTYFCIRRLVFAVLICLLIKSLVLQIILADFTILAMLIFYVSNFPMKDNLNNFIQIFNEIAVILLLQFTLMFTDFVADPVTRHSYGYYFLYCVATLIIINVAVLIVSLTLSIRLACRRYQLKKISKQIAIDRLKNRTAKEEALRCQKPQTKLDDI